MTVQRKLFIDRSEKTFTVVNTQDVEPILEANKEQRDAGWRHPEWGRPIARIPNTVYLQWFYEEQAKGNTELQMYSEEFDRIVAKKLIDADWAKLRIDRPAAMNGWLGFGS